MAATATPPPPPTRPAMSRPAPPRSASPRHHAPAAPGLALDPASDSGSSSGDGITNATTPTLSGTAEPGASIAIRRDGALVATVSADGLGAWS
ncbi:Ig-like domain-containing protein [Pseudoroseomonas cervicalis]|uniref:Ig-like domain-containing protein n=1 Tax=Teichococcus cervicalis TaxID=204525 RepID=UPI0035F0C6A9